MAVSVNLTPVPEEGPAPVDERAPLQGRAAFYCPNCGAFADQTWIDLLLNTPQATTHGSSYPRTDDKITPVGPFSTPDTWRQARCASCKKYSTWRRNELIYPAASLVPLPHADMPAEALAIYNEARAVSAVSRRAGAALARATLEKLLRVLLENERDQLIELIDQVEPLVNRSTADLLMFVRHVGNSALHVKGAPDAAMVLVLDQQTEDAFTALFATVNRLVEELITDPARTAVLVGTVPESVKATVEKLRAKRAQQGA